MNKKIVFVFNAIITRCIKRVEEFIDNGYEVDVYAFGRGQETYVKPQNFNITIIGTHDIHMSYCKRSKIIFQSLRNLFKKYKNEEVIYYFFFFDVASIGHFICNHPYIYEESDMPYTNMGNKLARRMMAVLDRRIIKHSLLTTMTSEGFIEYHYGNNRPTNIVVVPNKVNARLNEYNYSETAVDMQHLRFSFVGGFRYVSTLNFFRYGARHFPQHTFSVYGNVMCFKDEIEKLAAECPNVKLHGLFKNPEDLPQIYGETDLVLANYDAESINAQYAEPNKMYESIYFYTPIIVSSGTFLARKVNKLGVGYDIDSNNEEEVVAFINGLSLNDIRQKINNANSIPREHSVNKNPELFEYLKEHI